MNYGKLPPQAIDIESTLLGALMIDKNILHSVIPVLTEDIFYSEQNALTFRAIHDLYITHEPIDLLTVTERLKKHGNLEVVGGAYYLTTLTNTVASGANAETHLRLLIEKWMRRELIRICQIQITSAYDEAFDVFDVVNDLQSEIMTLTQFIQVGNSMHISKIVERVFKNALHAKENPQKLVGIPSGFIDLDRVTNGFKQPDLIVIAARPGMGKTALVNNIAKNASEQSYPIGIFSLEMSSEQLTERILAMYSGVQTGDIEKGNFEVSQLNPYVSKIAGLPIYMNDKAAISALEIMTAGRKMVIEHGVKMIFIDYIQLVTDRSDRNANREQQVSNISRSFKMMAKDLKIPVVALSQLSRKVEQRGDKRPMLSDLRESGAIEQDADRVMFLYKPDYYGITEEDGEDVKGKVELIIAKHRGGALGTINLRFEETTTTFTSWEDVMYSDEFVKF